MSGTSVDSVDAACIRCEFPHLEVLGTHTHDIPDALRQTLLETLASKEVPWATVCRLNMTLGRLFGETALALMQQLQPLKVDLIASHGQTLYHIPPEAGNLGATLQLGEPAMIAEITGVEVAADFRPGDMAAGGQGAPLVPFADGLLFQDKVIARAVQNIGGIANVTVLTDKGPVMAFDTGPGNMIIDNLVQTFTGKTYDKDGEIARQGQIIEPLLTSMLNDPYFKLPPPKSTGRELFGSDYTTQLIQNWQTNHDPKDFIATATHFTADSIVNAYKEFVLPKVPVKEVIVGGGGALNTYLMELLTHRFTPLGITVKTHEDFGIPNKYKEAIAFALLGAARKLEIPSNIPLCTGASHPVILGGLWLPGQRC